MSNEETNAALLAEIAAMRAEMRGMLEQIAANTKRSVDLVDAVTFGGAAMLVAPSQQFDEMGFPVN